MQCVVYHGFGSRASGERSPRRPAIGGLANRSSSFYPKFGASRFSTAGMASLRRVA
jgi:hypothetical protein